MHVDLLLLMLSPRVRRGRTGGDEYGDAGVCWGTSAGLLVGKVALVTGASWGMGGRLRCVWLGREAGSFLRRETSILLRKLFRRLKRMVLQQHILLETSAMSRLLPLLCEPRLRLTAGSISW